MITDREQSLRGKKVLVTGGAGYTGTVFIHKAVEEGAELTVYDNLTYGDNPLRRLELMLHGVPLQEALMADLSQVNPRSAHYKFIKGDTRDKEQVKSVVYGGNYDVVFHLAELVGVDAAKANPQTTREINYEGTKNVIAAVSNSYSRGVFLSSSSVYNIGSNNFTENSTLPDPQSLEYYARYKILGVERYVEQQARTHPDFEYVVLRPATVGGLSPRMRVELLPNLMAYALQINRSFRIGRPDDYRAFIDIDDLTDFYLDLAEGKHWRNGVYNVGSLNASKWEFANAISRLVGLGDEAMVQDNSVGDARSLGIDSSLAEQVFGFKAKRGLAEMLTPVIDLVRANPLVFAASENPHLVLPEFTNTPPMELIRLLVPAA